MAIRQDASTGKMIDDGKPIEGTALDANGNPLKAAKGPLMSVKVYAPFKVYYEGEGLSVTAMNETGPFDILPHHKNFMCMLIPCDLKIRTPYEEQTIKISRALMHVKQDKVTVYVDV